MMFSETMSYHNIRVFCGGRHSIVRELKAKVVLLNEFKMLIHQLQQNMTFSTFLKIKMLVIKAVKAYFISKSLPISPSAKHHIPAPCIYHKVHKVASSIGTAKPSQPTNLYI